MWKTLAGHLLPHPHTWRPSAFASLNDRLRSLIASGTWPCSCGPAHHATPDRSLLPFKQMTAPYDFMAAPVCRAPAWKLLEHLLVPGVLAHVCVRGDTGEDQSRGGKGGHTAPGWQWVRSFRGRKQDGSNITGFPSLEIILKN